MRKLKRFFWGFIFVLVLIGSSFIKSHADALGTGVTVSNGGDSSTQSDPLGAGISGGSEFLSQISKDVSAILGILNQGMSQLVEQLANDWLGNSNPSVSNSFPVNASLYSLLNTTQKEMITQQTDLATTLTQSLLKTKDKPPSNLSASSLFLNPVMKEANFPFALIGQKIPDSAQQKAAKAYIELISGSHISLTPPSDSGEGDKDAADNYKNFYNMLVGAQSYSAYILSGLYAERQSKRTWQYPAGIPGRDTDKSYSAVDVRQAMIEQLANKEWYTNVSTEPLGRVFRDLLVYTAQSFAVMNEVLQTQKQLLAAQAISNSLLILSLNQTVGQFMQSAAQGQGSSGAGGEAPDLSDVTD